jgi:hypothetical protein
MSPHSDTLSWFQAPLWHIVLIPSSTPTHYPDSKLHSDTLSWFQAPLWHIILIPSSTLTHCPDSKLHSDTLSWFQAPLWHIILIRSSTLTHYPDSKPASLCCYSVMLCAYQRSSKYQFNNLWFDPTWVWPKILLHSRQAHYSLRGGLGFQLLV